MRDEKAAFEKVQLERKSVVIPTYVPFAPDKNPIFHEKRAYQGAHGRIYPLPVTDKLSHEKVDKEYDSVTLENEYIKIMVLPEIGGRIHIGQDKTNGYNFIYHNTVIKPALIGIAGSWCSGGIEFNWPQHHRPTTFLPVETALTENEDGSKTAWVGEVEPLYGLKSEAGVTVCPGRSYLKVKVRAYNPTPFPQPFMWWANLGVHCNEDYKIVFPQDIKYLAFHDKAFISSWPMVEDRMTETPGVAYDGSWFKNHMPAGSFMVMDGSSEYDFIEGYDVGKQAGTVHVADRHISPGKKLFTWGNADSAKAWRGNLTDKDGYYLELMTGVYTDNQPDFSWMQPYETRTFEQVWYPVRDIGFVKNATVDAAVSMELEGGRISVGYYATGEFEKATVVVKAGDSVIFEQKLNIDPAHPFKAELNRPEGLEDSQLFTAIYSASGCELVSFRPIKPDETAKPEARTPSPEPKDIALNDELYIHGLHIEQYRHHSLEASDYYREALRRDPGDIRCNNAMGLLEMRAGRFEGAEAYFRKALERLKSRDTNPYDGEPEFNLGLALRFQRKHDEAYKRFYKATWNYAWKSPAFHALAEIDCMRGDFETALKHVDDALTTNAESIASLDLKSAILRHLGRASEAFAFAKQTLALDSLDHRAQFESYFADGCGDAARATIIASMVGKAEAYIGAALAYDAAGMVDEAGAVLEMYIAQCAGAVYPMAYYFMAGLCHERKNNVAALEWEKKAEAACPDYCFPNRLEYIVMLHFATQVNPEGAKAWYYLGNLYYDKMRYDDAILCWEKSRALDASFSIVHRNLAHAYFNKRKEYTRAVDSMKKAFEVCGGDPRLLFELLQALKNANAATVEERLKLIEGKEALVAERNDCYVEMLILLLQAGRLDEAAAKIMDHVFDIYEGGEGKLVRVYEWISILRGVKLLNGGKNGEALQCIKNSLTLPEAFHEGRNVFNSMNHVHYWAGLAAEAAGDAGAAAECFRAAAAYVPRPGEATFYRGLAFRKLGEVENAEKTFRALLTEGEALVAKGGRYDFFATGTPTPPPFEQDREKFNLCEGQYMKALAHIGLGQAEDGQWELEDVLARNASHLGAWLHAGRAGVCILR